MCLHAPHQRGLTAYLFVIICNCYFCFELPCIWKRELKSSETWRRVSRLMVPDVSRTANPHNAGHQKASHSRLPGPSETSACSLRHGIPCTYDSRIFFKKFFRKNTKHYKARYCCVMYICINAYIVGRNGLGTHLTVRGSNPGRGEILRNPPDRP